MNHEQKLFYLGFLFGTYHRQMPIEKFDWEEDDFVPLIRRKLIKEDDEQIDSHLLHRQHL